MTKSNILFALAAIGAVTASGSVEAKGCLRGAAAGAVAGHVAHHHAIAGAMAGCALGHHYYSHKAKKVAHR